MKMKKDQELALESWGFCYSSSWTSTLLDVHAPGLSVSGHTSDYSGCWTHWKVPQGSKIQPNMYNKFKFTFPSSLLLCLQEHLKKFHSNFFAVLYKKLLTAINFIFTLNY